MASKTSRKARHQELGSLVVSSGVIIKEMGGKPDRSTLDLGSTDLGVEPKIGPKIDGL